MRADILKQRLIHRRICHIHTAAQHRNHRMSRRKRPLERHGIHAARAAGNDRRAQPSKLITQLLGLKQAIA